jgi:hypothetical protein
MLNMGLLVCCSLPYVIISTPIIYSTVKTWFAPPAIIVREAEPIGITVCRIIRLGLSRKCT